MNPPLSRFSSEIYALLRIVAGLLFACHGSQKLLGFPGGAKAPLSPLIGVAGVIELVGGLMIAIGFFAGWAAFIASGLMAAAYFMAHAKDGFWPIVNRGELAVVYCFLFFYVASRGSGKWSVDDALRSSTPSVRGR